MPVYNFKDFVFLMERQTVLREILTDVLNRKSIYINFILESVECQYIFI